MDQALCAPFRLHSLLLGTLLTIHVIFVRGVETQRKCAQVQGSRGLTLSAVFAAASFAPQGSAVPGMNPPFPSSYGGSQRLTRASSDPREGTIRLRRHRAPSRAKIVPGMPLACSALDLTWPSSFLIPHVSSAPASPGLSSKMDGG